MKHTKFKDLVPYEKNLNAFQVPCLQILNSLIPVKTKYAIYVQSKYSNNHYSNLKILQVAAN